MTPEMFFIALICMAAMAVLLVSRIFHRSDNPKLDLILARIVLLALGALLVAWQLNG